MLSHANFCQLVTNGPKNENETRNCVIPMCEVVPKFYLGFVADEGNLEKSRELREVCSQSIVTSKYEHASFIL